MWLSTINPATTSARMSLVLPHTLMRPRRIVAPPKSLNSQCFSDRLLWHWQYIQKWPRDIPTETGAIELHNASEGRLSENLELGQERSLSVQNIPVSGFPEQYARISGLACTA
jgi:hypothetical protein